MSMLSMLTSTTSSLTRRRFLQRRYLSAVSREVNARNCRFHVLHKNPDAPHQILCLPGSLGTASTDFSVQLSSGIGEKFGLVAIDPRGLGNSNMTSDGKQFVREYPADFYLQDALDGAGIMKALGYNEYSVMGWSDGANAAMHLAANKEAKDAVKKLVVFGGNSYVTEEDIEAYEAVRDVSKSWSERMRKDKSAAHGGLGTLQILNDRYTDAMRKILYDYNGDVCLTELHNITCPTLILHGALDVICHEYHAQYIAKHITNSKLEVLEEGKHNLHMKYADQFRTIVGDFLTDSQENNYQEDDDEPQPDIDHIAYGFMGSKSLFAALRVGIFDAIDSVDGSATFNDIETACDISGERLKTLLSACVALKLIRRRIDENGTDLFHLPKASSKQLVRTSRQYWGDYLSMQVDGQFYNRLADIDNTIKHGTEASHGYEYWFDSDPEAAKNYTKAQHNGSLATAYALHKRLPELASDFPSMRMLDVGGGSGAFSIVTSRVIQDATAVVLDLPNVIETTKSIISEEEESVRSRVSTLALSATDPGSWENVQDESFDVVLLSYVSGSIPSEALAGLYSNTFRALKPGGKAIIHDFFLSNDGRGPPNAALWALAHISVNPTGMGLIPKRVINILSEQGFIAPRVHELIPGMTKVIVAKKKNV
eukprot:scaffold1140_cov149-Skeletonema_marinoi.AAC.5